MIVSAAGEFLATRAASARIMYRGVGSMRQYAGFATAEESNARYNIFVSAGTTGLSVALICWNRVDSGRRTGGEGQKSAGNWFAGRYAQLFDAIPPMLTSTSMTINATASSLLCLYSWWRESKNVCSIKWNGMIQTIFSTTSLSWNLYLPAKTFCWNSITDTFASLRGGSLNWKHDFDFRLSYPRSAGSTAAQWNRSHVSRFWHRVRWRGDFRWFGGWRLRRVCRFLNSHNNLLEEVAKLCRALGKDYARSSGKRKSLMLAFHCLVRSRIPAQQPEVNVVRTTIQAWRRFLGGNAVAAYESDG